jgi:hypothetical protein
VTSNPINKVLFGSSVSLLPGSARQKCRHPESVQRRNPIESRLAVLETKLNDFSPDVRAQALEELVSLVRDGSIQLEPEADVANMHCHTFFSFNAYGHSPISLAWLAKRRGIKLMGIVDFDVLAGVDEFLNACDLVGVRGGAGIETRVFIPEFATREINSPGEPGVYYHMGIGFTTSRVPERVSGILADLRQRAARRNQLVIERCNSHLDPVTIDYERDVLPLSPGGTPTERHIVVAYVGAAGRNGADLVDFWADKLDVARDQVASVANDPAKFQTLIRARLMKGGGVGYVQPTPDMFPSIEELHELTLACQALPCVAWLDGTSEGEQAIEELLELLIGKGVVVMNIIPDRNWNIPDPEARRLKVHNLYHVVRLAQEWALPLNVGTEMNSFGQKVVDSLDALELAPVRQAFIDGASFIYGHTVMQRALGLGYQSGWAGAHLESRPERNEFYTKLGYLVLPGEAGIAQLKSLDPTMSPADILLKLGE